MAVMPETSRATLIGAFAQSAAVMTDEQRRVLVDTVLALPVKCRSYAIEGIAQNMQHFAMHERGRLVTAVMNDHSNQEQRHLAMAALGAGAAALTSGQQLETMNVLVQPGVSRRALITVSTGVAGIGPKAKKLLLQRFAQHPNSECTAQMAIEMSPHLIACPVATVKAHLLTYKPLIRQLICEHHRRERMNPASNSRFSSPLHLLAQVADEQSPEALPKAAPGSVQASAPRGSQPGAVQPSTTADAEQIGAGLQTQAPHERHAGEQAGGSGTPPGSEQGLGTPTAASGSLGKHPRSEEGANAAGAAEGRQAPARQPRGKSLARLQTALVFDHHRLPVEAGTRIASFAGSKSPFETAQTLARLSEVSRTMRQAVQHPDLAPKSQRLAQLVQAARRALPQQLNIDDVYEKACLTGLLSPADRSRLVDVAVKQDRSDASIPFGGPGQPIARLAPQFEHFNDEQRSALVDGMLSLPALWIRLEPLVDAMEYLSPQARSDIVLSAFGMEDKANKGQALKAVAEGLAWLAPQQRDRIFDIAMNDTDFRFRAQVMSGLAQCIEHLAPEQRSRLVQQSLQIFRRAPAYFRWGILQGLGLHLTAIEEPQRSAVTRAALAVMPESCRSLMIWAFAHSAAVMTDEQRRHLVDRTLALPVKLRHGAIEGIAQNMQHFAMHERDRLFNAVLNDSGSWRSAHIALIGPAAAHFSPEQRQQLVTALMNDNVNAFRQHKAMASLCAGSSCLTAQQQLGMVRVLTGREVHRDHLFALSEGVAGLCQQAKDLLFQRFVQHPNLVSKLKMVTAMAPHFSSLNDGERYLLMQVATGPNANLANRDALSARDRAIAALGDSINKM